ncbi:hypothetical protein EYZ11_002965 [Aspergillus tanneri]|uniref:Uncharacterized protein n=1 Tax=Aspergillus tanneri TaxID=1220188 RepID=A0A4S3JPJ3_9EURO|nr:hypothetical protein EYZ11_002965 [Aspergillus tanneri]
MAATLPIELIRPPQNRREDLSSCTTILSLLAWRFLPETCTPNHGKSSHDSHAHVAPKGSQVFVYRNNKPPAGYTDHPPRKFEFPLVSSGYPPWTSVCRPPRHRGAGRVIQIYGLQGAYEDNNLTSPAEHVLGQRSKCLGLARAPRTEYEDADGVVDALEFTDNGTLLRITIGKGSTIHRPTRVRYLDNPDLAPHPPDLTNWRAAQLSISRFCRSGSLIYRSRHTQPRLQLPRTPTSPPLGAHDSPERLLL